MNYICYRCGGGEQPENTIQAISNCQDVDSSWAIEMDLNLTRDNEVVLFHDQSTHRITGVHNEISQMTLEEVKRLNAGFHFGQTHMGIPTLREVFSEFPKVDFVLDIHSTNTKIVNKVIALVVEYEINKLTIVSANDFIIKKFKERQPHWKYAASSKEAKKLIYSSFIYLDFLFPLKSDYLMIPKYYGKIKVLGTRIIQHALRRGKEVWAWIYEGDIVQTIETFEELEQLKTIGVNGVFTDFPRKLQQDILANCQL